MIDIVRNYSQPTVSRHVRKQDDKDAMKTDLTRLDRDSFVSSSLLSLLDLILDGNAEGAVETALEAAEKLLGVTYVPECNLEKIYAHAENKVKK